MANEEKKDVIVNSGDKVDEVLKIESEEDIAEIKEKVKEEVIAENGISPEEQKLFEKALEEASMPVELTNADFKLGASELDIRGLSTKNFYQMIFRQGVLNIVYLKQILTTLLDISRLLMVGLDKAGVENIINATDDIIEKIKKQHSDLANLVKDKEKHDA